MSIQLLASRTGAMFVADVETENDGSLTILSAADRGYRSAHRYGARANIGSSVRCINRFNWVNTHGVRVVATRWESAAKKGNES